MFGVGWNSLSPGLEGRGRGDAVLVHVGRDFQTMDLGLREGSTEGAKIQKMGRGGRGAIQLTGVGGGFKVS